MEEIPSDWKTGLIVKLPKKGDLSVCNNGRGITLLYVTSNVFSSVILDRISAAIDPLMRKEQQGFVKEDLVGTIFLHCGRSRNSARNGTCQSMQTALVSKRLSIAFTETLSGVFSGITEPPKIVSIIKLLYGDFMSKVINICTLPPFLFCFGIDWVVKETTLGTKAGIKWTFTETLDDLDFSDDTALLSHCYGDIQSKRENLARNAGENN